MSRGARNPNLQVATMHEQHLLYVANIVWSSTKNEWNAQKQSDHANLDLLSLVIWSRMFGHLSCDKLSKAHYCIIASLRRRCNLTWVGNICKAAPLSLFWAPSGLDELLEESFEFSFILIGSSTMVFVTSQSWRIVKSCYTGGGPYKDFATVSQMDSTRV